jgi:hypothetical protein
MAAIRMIGIELAGSAMTDLRCPGSVVPSLLRQAGQAQAFDPQRIVFERILGRLTLLKLAKLLRELRPQVIQRRACLRHSPKVTQCDSDVQTSVKSFRMPLEKLAVGLQRGLEVSIA